jgi:predicted nucleic acid-binding protein
MTAPEDFVLDGSVTLCWYFQDEADSYADAVQESLVDRRAHVPRLWHLEIANTLVMGERRNRSTQAQAASWLNLLRALPIDVDDQTEAKAWDDTLNLARAHKLTAYDAAYLELAMRRGLALATLDDGLKKAAAAAGVPLYEVTP